MEQLLDNITSEDLAGLTVDEALAAVSPDLTNRLARVFAPALHAADGPHAIADVYDTLCAVAFQCGVDVSELRRRVDAEMKRG